MGYCRAVSGIPALKTVHCQNWQPPTHLHHDHTHFRCYLTLLSRITFRIHLWHQIPEGMEQCSCRCPDLKAGCRNCEVHPGQSPWDWQEEQMVTTQWWLQLMKRYISKSGKLLSKLEPSICMWNYMWLTGWLLNGKVQYLRPWLSGFLIGKYRIWSISWEMTQTLRREWLSFESGKS